MANKTFLERKGRKNRHHIKAKKRGGTKSPENMILLDDNRHVMKVHRRCDECGTRLTVAMTYGNKVTLICNTCGKIYVFKKS